jgi:hypothetical protein
MKKITLIILLLTFLLYPFLVYAESVEATWNKLDKSFKYGIVWGFSQGFDFGLNLQGEGYERTAPPLSKEICELLKNTHMETMVNALDKFYADYANCNIPIVEAICYITIVMNGLSEKSAQKSLEKLRKLTADNIKKNPTSPK